VSPGEDRRLRSQIEESRAGASLDGPRHRPPCKLSQREVGVDLQGWDLLRRKPIRISEPNRLDWAIYLGEARLSREGRALPLQVTLQGDRIGGSKEFLQVRGVERSYQDFAPERHARFCFYCSVICCCGTAVWLGIQWTKSGETSWGRRSSGGAGGIDVFLQSSTTGRCGSELDTRDPLIELYSCADRAGAWCDGDGANHHSWCFRQRSRSMQFNQTSSA